MNLHITSLAFLLCICLIYVCVPIKKSSIAGISSKYCISLNYQSLLIKISVFFKIPKIIGHNRSQYRVSIPQYLMDNQISELSLHSGDLAILLFYRSWSSYYFSNRFFSHVNEKADSYCITLHIYFPLCKICRLFFSPEKKKKKKKVRFRPLNVFPIRAFGAYEDKGILCLSNVFLCFFSFSRFHDAP